MNTNSNVDHSLHELSAALTEMRTGCAAGLPASELVPCFDQMMTGVQQLRSMLLERSSLEKTLRMLALVNDRQSVGVTFTTEPGVLLYVDRLERSVKSGQYWERQVIGAGATLELATVDAVQRITDEQLQAHAHEIVVG